MTEYSVQTTNRFALSIEEDEDPHEILEQKLAEKKRKEELAAEAAAKAKLKSTSNKGKNDKKNSTKNTAKRIIKPSNDQSQTGPTQTGFSRNDENKPPRFARQARDGPRDNLNFEKPPQNFDRERRGGFGNRGRGGPPRGGFGRPKRDFDRHSGSDKTGVKAVEKREGGGPHNWGDEIQAQLEHTDDQKDTTTNDAVENGVDNDGLENGTNEVDAEPVPEEPKEMTLDEWRASQKKVKTEFKVRKANEGTDTKQWKGTVALQRKKKGDMSEEEYEDDSEEEEQEVDITKATLEKLNIEITFKEPGRSAPRGGRGGGRGRGSFSRGNRGGGGRGGGRGGFSRGDSKKSEVPQVNNEADFPSLGSR